MYGIKAVKCEFQTLYHIFVHSLNSLCFSSSEASSTSSSSISQWLANFVGFSFFSASNIYTKCTEFTFFCPKLVQEFGSVVVPKCPVPQTRQSLSLSPSGCESLWWGVSHTGSPSPFSTIPHVHHEPQVLNLYLTTSVHLFLCLPRLSVHERLPRGFTWHRHSHPLLAVVHVHTISVWPHIPCPWCRLLQWCNGCHHSFSCPSC